MAYRDLTDDQKAEMAAELRAVIEGYGVIFDTLDATLGGFGRMMQCTGTRAEIIADHARDTASRGANVATSVQFFIDLARVYGRFGAFTFSDSQDFDEYATIAAHEKEATRYPGLRKRLYEDLRGQMPEDSFDYKPAPETDREWVERVTPYVAVQSKYRSEEDRLAAEQAYERAIDSL